MVSFKSCLLTTDTRADGDTVELRHAGHVLGGGPISGRTIIPTV